MWNWEWGEREAREKYVSVCLLVDFIKCMFFCFGLFFVFVFVFWEWLPFPFSWCSLLPWLWGHNALKSPGMIVFCLGDFVLKSCLMNLPNQRVLALFVSWTPRSAFGNRLCWRSPLGADHTVRLGFVYSYFHAHSCPHSHRRNFKMLAFWRITISA